MSYEREQEQARSSWASPSSRLCFLTSCTYSCSQSCVYANARSTYASSIVATVLRECGTTDYFSYYSWAIAINIFYWIACFLLMFVVVYTLNTMLRAQLGHASAIYKYGLLAIMVILGLLTCGQIGFSSYINWTQTQSSNGFGFSRDLPYEAAQQYRAAINAFYLVSILAAAALAFMTLMSLRSRRSPAGVSRAPIPTHLPLLTSS